MALFNPSSAELGKIENGWINSYNGQKAMFINNSVMLYECGLSIKFYNIETKGTQTFVPPNINKNNMLVLLTANTANKKFAFSETQLSPSVYVYDFDSGFKEVSRLLDGTSNEYLSIEFSNGEAILTLSNLPELQIIVWNWNDGTKIGTISLGKNLMQPKYVCFCPTNWRQIVTAYCHELSVWNLEICENKPPKLNKTRLTLPLVDPKAQLETLDAIKNDFNYPTNAITNLNEKYGDLIDEILDKRERHTFSTLCWTNNNEILIATKQNYLLKYSSNDSSLKCIFKTKEDPKESNDLTSFEIKSLTFHRHGLLAVCNDGFIRLLDGSEIIQKKNFTEVQAKNLIDISSQFISNLSFNLKYTSFAVSSNKGIFLVDSAKLFSNDNREVSKSDQLTLVANYDQGKTLSIATLNPHGQNFLLLKETGCLQVWNIKNNMIVKRLQINEPCSYLATHSKVPLAAIGTLSGRLLFIDLSDELNPKIIENCRLHKKKIKLLKFNSSGSLLFSLGEDGKIFIIDTRMVDKVSSCLLSNDQRLTTNFIKKDAFEKGFFILGYVEFEGEAVCIDVYDIQNEGSNSITTRIAVGIHDLNTWETIKKSLQDNPFMSTSPTLSTEIENKNSGSMSVSYSHNLLIQTAQTQPVLSRINFLNNYKELNFNSEATQDTVKLACKLIAFDFNFNMFSDKTKVYSTKRLDLKDEIINKSVLHCHYLFSDLALINRSQVVLALDRFLTKFIIPEYEANKKASKLTYLELNEIVGSHDFGYNCLYRSLNNQFILSAGFDGSVQIRKSTDLKTFIEARAANFKNGGIQQVQFHNDLVSIIALGYDNILTCLNWNCTYDSTVRFIKHQLPNDGFDGTNFTKLVSYAHNSNGENQHTWFEMKEKEFFKEQDEQFLPIKKEILNGLNEVKIKLQELMKLNQSQEDLSKLKEHEFYLDLDELERLHKETDVEIQKIRDKTEFDNLAKLFVREMIKRECWDQMAIKGRGIQAFNTNLLVENYPIKERSRDEINSLERIKTIRRIEISAQKCRAELTTEAMKKDNIIDLAELDDDESKENETQTTNSSNNNNNSYLSPNLHQLAFKGSIGSLFNGDSSLFYNQFELYTREQKWIQVALIQDAIYRIKDNFNKEFEQIMQRKNQEIAKIREKNQRLKQIYVDISDEKQVPEPQFGDAETPEVLFDVKDDEIKVEKYLTAEQKRLLEEQLLEENRKRELEKLDNWRERGLMDMMGGVLQIRREDELKKDIPMPSFAKEKQQEEWTAEEVKLYQIYEQKVKELNEERDKLKKQLQSEINKINEQILECYQNFDNQLLGLHLRKVKTQQAVFQEELKIVRLVNSLVVENELETYETQLSKKLEKIKDQKKDLVQEIQQVKKAVEISRDEYERLSAEDKNSDKTFIREFSDVSSGLRDQLLKLFKKRAKPRMIINKTNLNPQTVFVPELGADNPFSDRPSTAQQFNIYDTDTELTLAELDDYDTNAPGGIDRSVWERFLAYRRLKIASENELKIKGLILAEMNLYLQKRLEEEEQKKKDIEEASKNSLALQELRLNAFHNIQIQFLMKQGQVEINPGANVFNFDNCLLINRNVVESLNKIIQTHGKQKISIMVDCKDFKKGIRQFEWEHRKMKMTIEDYIQKQRDITYLKLTREVQEFLGREDYDNKKQKEIATLEQTLAYQAKQFEKVYGQKASKLKEMNVQSVKTANANDQLSDKLRDNNVTLHERKHISQEMTGKSIEATRDERFQQIIQRRKLVDLAKAQAQEVAFLRSEVERLRMKTFPALVQIEF